MLKSIADIQAFESDVCTTMDHFKDLYRQTHGQGNLKHRFERYVLTKRGYLKKVTLQQLAEFTKLTTRTSMKAQWSTDYFKGYYNIAHDAKDQSQAGCLCNEWSHALSIDFDLEHAQKHLRFHKAICALAVRFEATTKDAMEAMIFEEPYFPPRITRSSRGKPAVQPE
jgi:hypothetical protein